MAENKVKMKIEEDGTISVSTDDFGDNTTHVQAEELISSTFELAGGESKVVQRKPGQPAHTHVHGPSTHQHTKG